jgi:hypothetical protein
MNSAVEKSANLGPANTAQVPKEKPLVSKGFQLEIFSYRGRRR